jgi:hypothetical protein
MPCTRKALRGGSMPPGYDNWIVALGTAVVMGLGACSTCCWLDGMNSAPSRPETPS